MFSIDYKSHKTIYEQVVDNIKEQIMNGVLPENTKLPSVRDLSKTLVVNPNTVAKAFKELDRQGYIYTVAGKGTFVSPKDDIVKDPVKTRRYLEDIRSAVSQLLFMGYSLAEVQQMVKETVSESNKERRDIHD